MGANDRRSTLEKIADNEESRHPPFDKCDNRFDNVKQIENSHCFVHDGITVRVLFEGTADLNELVKGLFLTG